MNKLIVNRSYVAYVLMSCYLWAYCASEVVRIGPSSLPINLQQISLGATCLAAIMFKIRWRPVLFFLGKLPVLAFFAYALFALISNLTYYSNGLVLSVSLVINACFMAGIFMMMAIPDYEEVLKKVYRTYRTLALLQVIMGLIQFAIPGFLPETLQPSGYNVLTWYRINGLFRDPTYYGFFLAVAIFWNVAVNGTSKRLYLENFILLLCIFLSGSFTVMLGLSGAYLIIVVLSGRKIFKYLIFGAIICSMVMGLLMVNTAAQTYVDHKLQRLEKIGDPRYNPRAVHLVIAYSMFFDKPILGHGYGSFQFQAKDYLPAWFYSSNYYRDKMAGDAKEEMVSHMLLATIMAEMGYVGIILITIFFIGTLITFIRAYFKFRDRLNFLFMIFWIMFLMKTVTYGFRLSDGFVLMHVALGFAYIYNQRVFVRNKSHGKLVI